jgi:hypothetical protein
MVELYIVKCLVLTEYEVDVERGKRAGEGTGMWFWFAKLGVRWNAEFQF